MTDNDHPQKLVECCDEFCGMCIAQWHKSEKMCPICSVYINCEDNPDFCHGCNGIGCICLGSYDEAVGDELCPVCLYYHDNITECVVKFYTKANNSVHNLVSEPIMLESIEEGDESDCEAI